MKKTKADVPAPKRSSKFLPEAIAAPPANNMRDERLAPMTFNMPREWHKEFKATALYNDMNMKDLLIESFEAWKNAQKAK